MPFNIEPYLTYLVLILGMLYGVDRLLQRQRKYAHIQDPPAYDWIFIPSRSFFVMLFIIWAIRSFALQPFRVPTGSLEPTILPGEFLLSNQAAYGIRLPVLNRTLIATSTPKRGDIVLFRYPVDPRIIYIKRVVGIPGDVIRYENKTLTINGQQATQSDQSPTENTLGITRKHENLLGVEHDILINPLRANGSFEVTVPSGQYFMMGDNRDNSNDSRYWGFVPDRYLVGRALFVWMSWDSQAFWTFHNPIRFERIGTLIH